MTWFLERDGVTLLTCVEDKTPPALPVPGSADLPLCMQKHPPRYPMKSHALKFKFLATSNVGAQLIAPAGRIIATPTLATPQSIEPQGELAWHNNYFLGNDSTKWAPNCRNYTNIVYRDVWDGIDIEWYEENGKLEFDFVVQPGADPNQIRMSCDGLEGDLSVSPSTIHHPPSTGAELRLPTSLGELRTALPQVYQISAGGSRSEVDAKFEITNKNEFGITLPNGYQKEHTLRIDPLIYSTFIGGSGNDGAEGACNDGNGGIYLVGSTGSIDFPITPGVIQTSNSGNSDCFVTHLNNDGSQLLYSTYLGGSGDDYGYGIAFDGNDGVYVTGDAYDFTFPHTTIFGPLGWGADCFVTHLNNIGSEMLYSVLIGGSNDDQGWAIDNDGNGGVIVSGFTCSTDYPTSSNAFDRTYNGDVGTFGDCFISRLNNSGTEIVYSTYLGGSGDERGFAIVSDSDGGAFVTGWTSSTNFPTTVGAFDTSFNGSEDCFITHLNGTGSQLIYSTLVGGLGEDDGRGIIRIENGEVFVVGVTTSTNFPTTVTAFDTLYNGSMDCFITRLNSTGSQLMYSTFIGGSGNDGSTSIVDGGNNSVVIGGATSSSNFPVTSGAYDTIYQGGGTYGYDGFISRLNLNNNQLSYSTFLNGTNTDYVIGLVSEGIGSVVAVGTTFSSNFPITSGTYDTSYNGGADCFVSRLDLVTDTSSVVTIRNTIPNKYSLNQNYPNPFNSSTTISYSLPKSGITNWSSSIYWGEEFLPSSTHRRVRVSIMFDSMGRIWQRASIFTGCRRGNFRIQRNCCSSSNGFFLSLRGTKRRNAKGFRSVVTWQPSCIFP